MKFSINTIEESLNKAYLKQSVKRESIELFKINLKRLFDRIDENESEEHLKNIVRDFLNDIWYRNKYEINTKDYIDLAIHNGKANDSTVGVIIESKRPASPERIIKDNFNRKALHELILYYFNERDQERNTEIKYLVSTNVFEWYLFKEDDFDKLFYRNTKFQKLYQIKIEQCKDNPFFYSEVEKLINELDEEISCTCFDLHDYKEIALNDIVEDDEKLLSLYKIFSPEHLLNLPFNNDSNSLNKEFYSELLHILGLEEYKEGSKKVIKRKKDEKRNEGSLLENTINILKYSDKLNNVENIAQYGDTEEERLFSISLELCITWLNRILFLKLLEGQLIRYNRQDDNYSFLNPSKITDFDELDELFFQVLALQTEKRESSVNKKFGNIPYLNSSLFEITELERKTIIISNLKDRYEIPLHATTVLKDIHGKRLTGGKRTLPYLFEFLDAFDFASDSSAKIQEQDKTLINASVLGLIFEKINGYKDGSFFTPGFITMYMCRETIRRSVVQKFNEKYTWQCENIVELYNHISKIKITEANQVINDLKICDPAVGSGHFLVSALNEILAIKSELGILVDRDGKLLREWKVFVENDDLIIINSEGKIFEYTVPLGKTSAGETQRVQETLFHEKETIIENCLFGVDVNPKSVMICRLRLWIELLKNAYYTGKSDFKELETLPNIDINIKCGNSLVNRFPLDADLSKALKTIKFNINNYRKCVLDYKNANNKEDKRSLEALIDQIKNNFRDVIHKNDPKYIRLNKVKGEIWSLTNQTIMFELSQEQKTEFNKKVERFTDEQAKLEKEITDIQNNIIYRNAFEWRFEFPEVLDDEGSFLGFDIVIGNPPYVSSKEFGGNLISYLNHNYKTSQYQLDLYIAFVELGVKLLKTDHLLSLITPNSWLKNINFSNCRKYLLDATEIQVIISNMENVFEEASVDTLIFIAKKCQKSSKLSIYRIENQKFIFSHAINQKRFQENERYIFDVEMNDVLYKIIEKVRNQSVPLVKISDITRGVNPYDKYTGQSEDIIKTKAYHATFRKDDSYLPEIRGKHVFSFFYQWDNKHFISYGPWLAAPRELRYFQGQRIIMRQVLGEKLNCTIISEGFHYRPKCFYS